MLPILTYPSYYYPPPLALIRPSSRLIPVLPFLAPAPLDATLSAPVRRHPDHSVSHHLPYPEPPALLAASQPLKPVAAQPPCSCFPFLSALMHTNRLNHPPALARSLHPPLHLPANLNPPHPSSPPPLLPFAPSHLSLTAAPENIHLSTSCRFVPSSRILCLLHSSPPSRTFEQAAHAPAAALTHTNPPGALQPAYRPRRAAPTDISTTPHSYHLSLVVPSALLWCTLNSLYTQTSDLCFLHPACLFLLFLLALTLVYFIVYRLRSETTSIQNLDFTLERLD